MTETERDLQALRAEVEALRIELAVAREAILLLMKAGGGPPMWPFGGEPDGDGSPEAWWELARQLGRFSEAVGSAKAAASRSGVSPRS